MTTTPEGRRELKALAEKATPGPWKADGTIYEHMVSEIRSIMPGEERGIAQVWQHPQGFADARFIAAANPATVLSLLAALEEAEGREAALREALTKAAEYADEAGGTCLALAMSGKDHPRLDDLLMGLQAKSQALGPLIRAALTKSETPSDV